MNRYYFETLSLHPQPRRLESLTSYLTRLAEANGINSVSTLMSLCFPELSTREVRFLKDFPPNSFKHLELTAVCIENTLKSATFYYIATKFGRPATRQSLASFLLNSISKSLRYCPVCLTKQAYYSLAWRFVDLDGCLNHRCKLQDRCPHCDSFISLLKEPLRIGYCPECHGDLRKCTTASLTLSQMQFTQDFTREIEFLLLPDILENITNINKVLGRRFALLRHEKGFTLEDVAAELKRSLSGIDLLELGEAGSLQMYLQYASFLNVSLRSIFEEIEDEDIKDKKFRKFRGKLNINEEKIIEDVKEVVENLMDLNAEISLDVICQQISLSPARLRKYPRADRFIRLLLEERHLYEKKKSEQEIYRLVQKTIMELEEHREIITYTRISEITGISRDDFKLYPRIYALFEAYINYPSYQKMLTNTREEELFTKTKEAINWLKEHRQAITAQAIAKIVGISSGNLKRYPSVKSLIEISISDTRYSVLIMKNRIDEDELYEAVQNVINDFKTNKHKITFSTVARAVGMKSSDKLRKYPKTRSLLEKHVTNVHPQSTTLYRLNEERFYSLAKDTVNSFVSMGQPINFTNVCSSLGLAPSRLRFYPRVRDFIEKNVDYSYLAKESLKKEEELMMLAENYIKQLEDTEAIISKGTICDALNIKVSSLKSYHCLREMIGQITNLSSSFSNRRVPPYNEEELLVKAKTIIENLKSCGQKILKPIVCKELEISQRALKGLHKLDSFIMQCVEEQQLIREIEVLERVKKAVCELEKCAQEITNKTLSKAAHISVAGLYYYPRVSSFVKDIVRNKRNEERRLREDKYVNKVVEEIKRCQQLKLPISLTNIAKELKMTPETLRKYSCVKHLLEDLKP